MTEDERAARGWPSTARVPLCRRSGAVRGATGAVAEKMMGDKGEESTPVSGPLSASQGALPEAEKTEGPL